MIRADLAGCLGLVLAAAFGCTGSRDSAREVVRAWLSCEACDNGEREAVAALGTTVVPLLTEPLDPGSRGGRNLRQALEVTALGSYQSLAEPSMESAAYLDLFVGNALAAVQARAAASLGDVGAADAIQEALDERTARGLRPEVVRALETALIWATTGSSPPADRVELVPPAFEMEVGDSVILTPLVLDAAGTPLPDAVVAWATVGSSAISVDTAGRVFGVSLGEDTVIATYGESGLTGRALVRVVAPTPLPVLSLVDGALQTGAVGTVLGSPLVVRLLNRDGTPAAGQPISWVVASGGGVLLDIDYRTRPDGTARAGWLLGGQVGSQRVRVMGPRNVPLQIRATAVPDTLSFRAVGVGLVDGRPLLRLPVEASNGEGMTTGPDGRFLIPFAASGTYALTAWFSRSPVGGTDATESVTVTPDAPLAVVRFETSANPGAIAGGLFLDENPRNNVFDEGREPLLRAEGVLVYLVGSAGDTLTTRTDGTGEFLFPSLPVGSYTVELDPSALRGLPGVSFGGPSPAVVVSVSPGAVTLVRFPFDPA